MIAELKDYDTAQQAAKKVGVHSATIRRWIQSGKIRPGKVRYELDQWFIHRKEIDRVVSLRKKVKTLLEQG
jgi:excisionase family DNA binding protein